MKKSIKDQSCNNCAKRWKINCAVYKEENKRPPDSSWCYGWRKNQEAIQTIVSLRIELASAKHEGSPMILNNIRG